MPGAPPARPLAAYAGEYGHPGYGILTITLDGNSLRPCFATMDPSLAHRHYETLHSRRGSPLLQVSRLTTTSTAPGSSNRPAK